MSIVGRELACDWRDHIKACCQKCLEEFSSLSMEEAGTMFSNLFFQKIINMYSVFLILFLFLRFYDFHSSRIGKRVSDSFETSR